MSPSSLGGWSRGGAAILGDCNFCKENAYIRKSITPGNNYKISSVSPDTSTCATMCPHLWVNLSHLLRPSADAKIDARICWSVKPAENSFNQEATSPVPAGRSKNSG